MASRTAAVSQHVSAFCVQTPHASKARNAPIVSASIKQLKVSPLAAFSKPAKQSIRVQPSKRNIHRLCVRNDLEEPVTIDNATVLVVGGGGLGMDCLRQMAKKGSWVTAFHRGDKFRKEIESLGSMLAIGDVMKPETIDKAFRTNTFDAVVCTVGGGLVDVKVDSEGAINVIKAAEKAKVPRFVLVTSIGTGDSAGAVSEKEMEILGPVLKEKEIAEAYLKNSDIQNWTIVRPGGLLTNELSDKGFFTEDNSVVGSISRAETANLILKILFTEKANRKVLAAIENVKALDGRSAEKIEKFNLN